MRTQGERIKKLRKSKGVTQRELAERLGISEQAVSKWEKNLSNPSTKNLLQIAKIFGVSITYFYQITLFPKNDLYLQPLVVFCLHIYRTKFYLDELIYKMIGE